MVILARKYIAALDKSGETSDRISELVDVIVVAVASAPLNNTQISFFVDLVVKSKLWRGSYMLLVAGRFLDWAESPRQGWCELRMLLEDEIDAATDPTTASGRALIESIAERLTSDQIPESLDVSGARMLKDRIYGMDSPANGPFISDAWPTPADIPPGLRRLLAA